MLIPAERTGLEKLLDHLESYDLFSLCDTITKRMVRTSNRSDAIGAILSCIEKPSDLLKRQKITRKVLFSYLLEERGTASPESSKVDLITMCLDLWKSSDVAQAMDCREEMNCNNKLEEMGLAFTNWFFPLYNQLQGFGIEHFWADCKLEARLQEEGCNEELVTYGDKDVVNFLTSLIKHEKLLFYPNKNGGTFCEQEAHGLVKINVRGIVYKLNNCVGLFDFSFGLVRNPAHENNWKIKWLYICIRRSASVENIMLPFNCQ